MKIRSLVCLVLLLTTLAVATPNYGSGQAPAVNDLVVCSPPSATQGVQILGRVVQGNATTIAVQVLLQEDFSPMGASQWYLAHPETQTWNPGYCQKVY